MRTSDLYVIVNMVTAELVCDEVFESKLESEIKRMDFKNQVGSYVSISL